MAKCSYRPRRAAALLATIAIAAGAPVDDPKALAGLAQCRAIADDAARLACLDRAADALLAAEREHRLVVLTPGDVERTRQSMFGFTIPDLKAFGAVADRPAPPVAHLVGKVVRTKAITYGKYEITLDSGAVWRNIDLLTNEPLPNAAVKIDRTPVGGYLMKLPYESSVHAARVR